MIYISNKKVFIKSLVLVTVAVFGANCTNETVFSDLVNTRLTMKMKGTYESNDPHALQPLYESDGIAAKKTGAMQTYVDDATLHQQIKWYFDIAEVRMSRDVGKSDSEDVEDYWEFVAQDRMLMCSDTGALYDKTLRNCGPNGGITRLAEFFQDGFTYPAVDIPSGLYRHMGIYFRKMVTYPAKSFDGDGDFVEEHTANFDNRQIYGYDVEQFYQYAPSDDEYNADPRMFPLQRNDLGLSIYGDERPFVVEVRVFLKNLLMKHIYHAESTLGNDNTRSFVFVGPSDWYADQDYDNLTYGDRMGRNVIFTARVYHPAESHTVNVTGDYTNANPWYYALVGAGSTFESQIKMPEIATAGAASAALKNVPDGSYDLYITCDQYKCTSSDTTGYCASSGQDGFPETSKLCQSSVTVSGADTTVDASGCTCP